MRHRGGFVLRSGCDLFQPGQCAGDQHAVVDHRPLPHVPYLVDISPDGKECFGQDRTGVDTRVDDVDRDAMYVLPVRQSPVHRTHSAGGQAWTNASISAAERSWDGRRVRQFDADTILGLASALGLPVSALFLPPEDDGVEQRYLMDLPDVTGQARCVGMRDLLELVTHAGGFEWEGDADDEALQQARMVNERYRQRLDAALAAYRVEGEVTYAQDAWGTAGETDPEIIHEKLERTRRHYEALRQLLGDIARVQDQLYAQLGETNADMPEEGAQ